MNAQKVFSIFFWLLCQTMPIIGQVPDQDQPLADGSNQLEFLRTGTLVIYDRVGANQFGDDLYLEISGTTVHFTPSVGGSLVQKFNFSVPRTGYLDFEISGATLYRDGSSICAYGYGSIWISANRYQQFEIQVSGLDSDGECLNLVLTRL